MISPVGSNDIPKHFFTQPNHTEGDSVNTDDIKVFLRPGLEGTGRAIDTSSGQRFYSGSRRLQTQEIHFYTQPAEDDNEPSVLLDFHINPNDTTSYKDALKPRPKPKSSADEERGIKNSMIIMNNLRTNGHLFETVIENDNAEGNTGFQGLHKDMKVVFKIFG